MLKNAFIFAIVRPYIKRTLIYMSYVTIANFTGTNECHRSGYVQKREIFGQILFQT